MGCDVFPNERSTGVNLLFILPATMPIFRILLTLTAVWHTVQLGTGSRTKPSVSPFLVISFVCSFFFLLLPPLFETLFDLIIVLQTSGNISSLVLCDLS